MTIDEDLAQLVEKFKNGYYKRPDSVKFPTVWMRFDGKTPRADGTYPRFRIQDVTDEWVDEILSCIPLFMSAVVGDEVIKAMGDGLLENFTILLWRAIMKDRVALMCVTDDGEIPELAGFQMNEVGTKLRTSEDIKYYSDKFNSMLSTSLQANINVRRRVNIFKKYNVPCYLDAFALFVKPEFRHQGIATHLLRAKIPLCKALGIRVIANGFGSDIASCIAEKVGFELLDKETFTNVFEIAAEKLPETSQNATFMGMRVE